MQRRTLLTSTLLASTLVAGGGALAGCSGSSGGSGSPALRLAWWGNSDRAEATEKVISAFTAANPGISVAGETSDFAAYFDKLATQTAGNDAPDVFALGGAYPAEYAGRGALLDLSTVKDQLDLTTFMDAGAIANGQVQGVQYGVTTGTNALSMIINPKVFTAAKVDLPDTTTWSWDDFAQTARAITDASPKGTYGTASTLTHDSLDLYARQRGEMLYTADGKLGLTQSTIEAFLGFSKELSDSGAAPPASVIEEQRSVATEQTLMGTGQAATMLIWSNFETPLSAAAGRLLTIGGLPGEAEQPGVWLQSSQYWAISRRTDYPEQAAQLVAFLVNDPAAAKIILNDRGVSASAAMRTVAKGELAEPAQAEVAYIDTVSKLDLKPTYIGPTGSTAVQDITNRALSDTLFGRKTPAAAASGWISETEQAIA